MRRVVLAHLSIGAALSMMTMAATNSAAAQQMELPAALQVPLFLKAISLDRQRNVRADSELVVAVCFEGKVHASVAAKEAIAQAFRNASSAKQRIRVVSVNLDHDTLAEAVEQQHATLVYLAPVRLRDVAEVVAEASHEHVITFTGVADFVERGIAVGAHRNHEHAQLIINREAARAEGAEFGSELLKLSEIVR